MNDSDVGPVESQSSTPADQPTPLPAAAAEEATERQTQPQPLAERVDHIGRVEKLSTVIARIQSHPDLSPGMRQRLAEVVGRQPPEQGPAQIPLDDVLAILAETVPSQLRLAAGELSPAAHPEGEAFFSGNPADDAERQATQIAREQLALSGLLRTP
jgi:hypothetical protein